MHVSSGQFSVYLAVRTRYFGERSVRDRLTFAVALLLVLCQFSPIAKAKESLGTARGNFQRTGQFSQEAPLELSELSWSGTAGQRSNSNPVLLDDTIYYVDGVGLRVKSASDGSYLWSWKGSDVLGEPSYPAKDPLIDGNTVYLSLWSTYPGTALVALDKDSGDMLWKVVEEVKGDAASPILFKNQIIFGRGNYLICIDKETRKEIWRRKEISSVGHLSLLGDTIVYGFISNVTIKAASVHDGNELWRAIVNRTTGGGYIATSEGMAFVGTWEGVAALDLTTGKPRWSRSDLGYTQSEVAVDDERVYAGSRKGVFALDKSTGEIRWTRSYVDTLHSTPSVAGKTLYVVVGQYLVSIDKGTGEILAKIEGEFRGGVGPAIGSHLLVIPGGRRYEDKLFVIR